MFHLKRFHVSRHHSRCQRETSDLLPMFGLALLGVLAVSVDARSLVSVRFVRNPENTPERKSASNL